MLFDFETSPAGAGDHCSKWDHMERMHGVSPVDGIAMWVADMDFRAAPVVLDALRREVERGYMGYFGDAGPVNDAVAGWMARMHGWRFDPEVLRYTPGVVAGFGNVLAAFSAPGDEVVLFPPVYHAFYGKARSMGREILESPLVLRDGRYEMDLAALEAALTPRTRIVTVCSPHNPGGRLWSAEELRAVADLCARRGLLLLSDEIHMDLAFPGVAHLPTAVAVPDAAPRLVTITAASKGFNLAGGETGFVVIEDADLRAAYDVVHKDRTGTPNRFGMIMTKAAFEGGAAWSAAVRGVLADNFALWRARIGALPGIEVMDMQSTYLSWVDFRGTGLTIDGVDARIRDRARIAKSPGTDFGTGGAGWNRFNLAMPRARLEEAIARLEEAFSDIA